MSALRIMHSYSADMLEDLADNPDAVAARLHISVITHNAKFALDDYANCVFTTSIAPHKPAQEATMNTTDQTAADIYIAHVYQPYGKIFAETVGRFQEGFLRDKVGDLDEAFALAVDAAVRLLPAIKIKSQMAA